MEKFSWTNEPELMARLGHAQNHLKAPIDIMTCVGFFDSREQLVAHVERYEAEAA
jgi:hypothetical protein